MEENFEQYFQATPPELSLHSYQNMPIALFCGATDKLSSPLDYMWLRDELLKNQNCVYYKEYHFGHVAFLMPPDKRLCFDILALCKKFVPQLRQKEPNAEVVSHRPRKQMSAKFHAKQGQAAAEVSSVVDKQKRQEILSPELEQMKKEAENEVEDLVRCMAEASHNNGVNRMFKDEKQINIIEDYMDGDQVPK